MGDEPLVPSDAQLLVASRTDPSQFGVFYDRHAAAILTFCTRPSGWLDTGVDLTGEVFAAAYARRASFPRTGASAYPWLYGIARRQVGTFHRRRRVADRYRRRFGITPFETTGDDFERVLDRLREELVHGIPRFERARHRARILLAATGALLVLATSMAAFLLFRSGSEGGRLATEAPATTAAPPATEYAPTTDAPPDPDSLSGYTVEQFSDGGVPAVLLASNRGGAVAVIDLEHGARALYPREAHTIAESGGNPIRSAVLTNNDELIVWGQHLPTLVYPAKRTADGQQELVDGGLQSSGREIGGTLDHRQVVPTDSGDRAWIQTFPRGPGGAFDDDSLLELVDMQTGEIEQSLTVPASSRVVDVTGENAVIDPTRRVGGTEVSVVSPSGETTIVEAPEPGWFVAATAEHMIWTTGDRLLIVADDGRTHSIPTPAPDDGGWTVTGWPSIPGSPRMRTLDAEGKRLLVASASPGRGEWTRRLVVVDIEESSTEVVYEDPDLGVLPTAFWAADNRTVIVVDGFHPRYSVTAIDTVTGETTSLDEALPDGFFVIAGR